MQYFTPIMNSFLQNMNNIFKPIKINSIKLKNRLLIGPMCQYSARNGVPTEWHYKHYSNLSKLEAGLVILESTAVSKEGRITKKDLILSNNIEAKKMSRLIKFIKKDSSSKFGIQISHSGRKGSVNFNLHLGGNLYRVEYTLWT